MSGFKETQEIWDFRPLRLDGGEVIMDDKMQPQDQSPATKADLREFATKADLREFATKADLREFVTKLDFQLFAQEMRDLFKLTASREDLKNLVTRDEFRRTAVAVAKLTEDVADIRNHIKEKLVTRDEFHSRMDGFAGHVLKPKNLS